MPLANVFISVYVAPFFHLVTSLWLLALVIVVEALVLARLCRAKLWPALGWVTLANVVSTGCGFAIIFLLPNGWNVTTSHEFVPEPRLLYVFLGYIACFAISAAIEYGVFRLAAVQSKTRFTLRATIAANALTYALMPAALWCCETTEGIVFSRLLAESAAACS